MVAPVIVSGLATVISIGGKVYKAAAPLVKKLLKEGVGKAVKKLPSKKEVAKLTKAKANKLLGGDKITPLSMSQKGVGKVVKKIAVGSALGGGAIGYLAGKDKEKPKDVVSSAKAADKPKTTKKLEGVKPGRKPPQKEKKSIKLPQVENREGEMVKPKVYVDGDVTVYNDEIDAIKPKKKYAYGGSATKKSYTMPKSSTQQYIQRNDGGMAKKTRIF